MYLIELGDQQLNLEGSWGDHWFSFTTSQGQEVSFTKLGLFDPSFHKKYKLKTLRAVAKFWIEHREAMSQSPSYESFLDHACAYFYYLPMYTLRGGDYEDFKGWLSGQLLSPPLELRTPHANAEVSTFKLVEQPLPLDVNVPTVSVTSISNRVIYYTTEGHQTLSDVPLHWRKVHNYTYRTERTLHNWFRSVSKENNTHFGMELEVSTKLGAEEIQHIVTNVEPKQEPFFIFKRDGSITGKYKNSLELVTVPCTPRYLRKNWKIFFQKLDMLTSQRGKKIKDYFDVSPDLNNGLHIHVSKDSFNYTGGSHASKFLTAWHQWDKDAVSIISDAACRPNGYEEHGYCRIYTPYKATKSKTRTGISKFERASYQRSLAKRLKGIRVAERGTVAHDGNSATIEVRVFQGIFDLQHVIRSISFTEAMFEYSLNVGYSGFDDNFASSFLSFIQKQPKFKAIHNIFSYSKGEVQCV